MGPISSSNRARTDATAEDLSVLSMYQNQVDGDTLLDIMMVYELMVGTS